MGSINSACNPIFYMFMPSFRLALLKTFLPCGKKNDLHSEERSTANNSVTGTSVSTVSNVI